MRGILIKFITLLSFSGTTSATCNLEMFFSKKRVSIEEATLSFPVVFRGVSLAMPSSTLNLVGDDGEFTARFELLNTFKDASKTRDRWSISADSYNRRVNVTIKGKSRADCETGITSPQEYIVFGEADDGKVLAASVTEWNELADQRVWRTLGWSQWSEWSACSVSCSSGIQQRTRRCLTGNCPGYNVEQRHCNIFGCNKTINPLELQDGHFFHPSKDRWKSVPDRTSAWRLEPYTYLWVPSVLLLTGLNITEFPRQFSIFFTVRLNNDSTGTIFSLRSRTQQDTYLSIDLRQTDLKLVHAAHNGSDTLIIPMNLADNHWHQIAISIRDGNIVDCFVDCQWTMTDILKSTTLDLPEDSDLIIGYLFSGDVEQLSLAIDPSMANLHCSSSRTPIIDPSMENT